MTFATEIYKNQCITVGWHVSLQGPDSRNLVVETPFLTLGTTKWAFKREIFTASDLLVVSFLKKCENSIPENFLCRVQLRNKDRPHLLICCKEINSANTELFRTYQNSVSMNYPRLDLSQNTLKFIFTVCYGRCKQENKSAQTCREDLHSLENLSLDLSKLMDKEADPDVQLKCGKCTLPAHKLILSARSEVFRAMLQSDMLERRNGSVEIVDMEPKVFQVFIRYLYTGRLDLSKDVALPLYEAADKYHVNTLRERCSNFLAENLTREKACEVLAVADAHSDKDLKECVTSYILDKKIPNDDDVWSKFSDSHPQLALEVFSRAYKQFTCSQ